MVNLKIASFKSQPKIIEIVERKGIGHPDTICDSIVEKISIELAKCYLKKFGEILHYNIDKALLAAGEAENKFGGGKIIKPMLFVIGDRATSSVESEEVPINEIVENCVYSWFKDNMRFVEKENVKIQNEIKKGSQALQQIFKERKRFFPANDTSALVGYAPLTKLENAVYKLERFINSSEFKAEYPETGEDVKIMGLRENNNYNFTIAIAFVDRFIDSEENYFKKKEEIKTEIENYLKNEIGLNGNILLNTLDERGRGEDGCYLTVTGTCAEAADSGEVGRGNRVNGLISLNRPAGSEAAAGKNVVSHVGKIYNILSFKIANEIYDVIKKGNYVWLLSQIGKPINEPVAISVEVNNLEESDKKEIEEIVSKNFENIDKFIEDLINGKYKVV